MKGPEFNQDATGLEDFGDYLRNWVESVKGLQLIDVWLWIVSVFDRYSTFWTQGFDFKGRTKRIDYWTIVLVNILLGLVLAQLQGGFYSIYALFAVASIVPGVAMQVRRIRDTGRQWQWIFIALIPFIGALWLLWIVIGPSAESSQEGWIKDKTW